MYYNKYIKYKTKYLELKNQTGAGPGFLNESCKWVCSAAAYAVSSTITNCDSYYNKNREGKYTTYYEFQNMDQLNDFINYVYMKTFEYSKDTLLYEKITFKNCKSESKMPELVKLLLESKISKAKMLELIFSKQDVEKYTNILNKKYTANSVMDTAIVSFINTIPQHVINSVKNMLYIDNENNTNTTNNIWDDYSILLSFVACLLDSNVITSILPIETIHKKIKELDLPVTVVFLDLLLDQKFSETSRNLHNLYEDYARIRNIKINGPKEKNRDAEYKKINDFTVNDFFDPTKNTLFCLPPSVLFILLIKINPDINKNDNSWNQMFKQDVKALNVKCDEKSSSPHFTKDKVISPEEEKINKEIAEGQQKLDQLKKDIKSDPCAGNVFLGIDFNRDKNKCSTYYQNKSDLKTLQTTITNQQKQPTIINKAALNAFIKATDVNKITDAVCKNAIEWDIFNGFLNRIYSTTNIFTKLTGSHGSNYLYHTVIQQIAGFITYLPIDLKIILHKVLQIKPENIKKFDDIYDYYRAELYKNYTDKKDENYYLDSNNEKIIDPLYPPTNVLIQIQRSMI